MNRVGLCLQFKDIRTYTFNFLLSLALLTLSSPPLALSAVTVQEDTSTLSPIPDASAINPQPVSSLGDDDDIGTPRYKKASPELAVQLSTSFSAFGRRPLLQTQVDNGNRSFYAFSLLVDYQPAFIQPFGVLGFGPSFTIYPAFNSAIVADILSLFAVGGQVHYQARYFREQPVVPIVGYAAEYLHHRFLDGRVGGLVAHGPTLGLMVLLNFLEPAAAAQQYVNTGISRSYAFAEYRRMSGSNFAIDFADGSYYFGLRFEF